MSERSESKRINAKQHKNSGRNTQKGDATWKNFIVDFKESKKSFTINKDIWAKIVTDSLQAGTDKSPAIVVILGEGNTKVRLAIIEMDLLDQLTNIDKTETLTADLQRLQAEYANYRKRVDRDRQLTSELAFTAVLSELLPVLDDLERASEHGELTGGFKAVSDRINTIVEKLGLSKFADAPVPFNPEIHEALTHETSNNVEKSTATKILQSGYKFKERLIRPARVVVCDPEITNRGE